MIASGRDLRPKRTEEHERMAMTLYQSEERASARAGSLLREQAARACDAALAAFRHNDLSS